MWIRIAAVFGVVGVALGAFGAHALRIGVRYYVGDDQVRDELLVGF